jgi:hypothetical protein
MVLQLNATAEISIERNSRDLFPRLWENVFFVFVSLYRPHHFFGEEENKLKDVSPIFCTISKPI